MTSKTKPRKNLIKVNLIFVYEYLKTILPQFNVEILFYLISTNIFNFNLIEIKLQMLKMVGNKRWWEGGQEG